MSDDVYTTPASYLSALEVHGATVDDIPRLVDTLRQLVDSKRKLWLVVIKDKELAGEPDVGVGIVEGTETDAHNAGATMLQALGDRGRARCTARATEIEVGKFYRATMWLRTAP